MKTKKVLFIAYHFPPDGAAGAIRPAKFVKYLDRLGWKAIVLTIREKQIVLRDSTRLADVGGAGIVRTRVLPTVAQILLKLRDSFIRKNRKEGIGGGTCSSAYSGDDSGRPLERSQGKDRLVRYLASLFELPDKEIGWLIPAVWQGVRLVRQHGIEIVVTTSPPRSVSLVGLVLSYLTQIKLFTDLRDPWFEPWESDSSQTWISNMAMGSMERLIMERSTRVITTTEEYCHYLRSFYKSISEEKFCTIMNGYDEDDFRNFETIRPNKKFLISYIGTFYLDRTPKVFLRALGELAKNRDLDDSRLIVRFIGDVRFAEGELVEDMVRYYGLSGCVKILESIPYKDALKAMKESHMLLLFAPDQYYCIPAKAFEYIGSGRSILCFSQRGATEGLIRRAGSGIVVEPDDIYGIKSAILRFYDDYLVGRTVGVNSHTNKYDRKNATKDLARLFEESILTY